MTHKIISREIDMKIDNRTTAVKQAAKALGVTVKNAATEVNTVYGADQAFSQVWWTKCGNNLVISADNKKLSAALCTSDFDWDSNPADDQKNYRKMDEAAGLR